MTKLARLSDETLLYRLIMKEQHETINAAARAVGISPSSMSVSLKEARHRGLTPTTKLKSTEAKLSTQVKLLKQELAQVQRTEDTAESIRKEIYGLAEMTPDPPKWINPKKSKPGSPGVPMVCISDIHFGERVHKAQVGGVNEYNRKIAVRRLETLFKKICDLAYNHMVNPSYPGIVCCLGGDMITGAIHEELAETNDGTTQQALLGVQECLIAGIERLADTFGRVFCPCVIGNHGRDTHKPRHKNAVFHSYEWNLYCQLERHFRDDKRVQFMIPGESDCFFTVAGHRYYLTHGDKLGVAGGDGMIGIIGPIARGRIKVGRQQAQVNRAFDTMICCHYHVYTPRGDASNTIVNGSVIGYNEYAHERLRAPYARPAQALWFSHPDYGPTCQWPVYLEKQQRSIRGKADWVTWQGNTRYDIAA